MNDLYIVCCNINQAGMIGDYKSCKMYYEIMKKQYKIMYFCKIIESNYDESNYDESNQIDNKDEVPEEI